MSVHHTLALAGQYRARQEIVTAAQQNGASVLYTTTIPAVNYEEMLTEVWKLKPQKSKNWKGALMNNVGQKTRVQYDTLKPVLRYQGASVCRTLRTR